jgi:hypothetical protein
MQSELLPWLRAQEGFLDLITLADPGGVEVQAISFWAERAHAEAQCNGYPAGVLRILEALLDGSPRGKTFDVITSTVERFAPATIEPGEAPSATPPDSEYSPYETNA